MGITIQQALIFKEWFDRWNITGPAATLGVAALPFTMRDFALALGRDHADDGFASPRAYFAALGIEELVSLDVSDYEGADVIFDLNAPELPLSLTGRFGVVLNIGTLEHVFHLPNALANITRMLRDGGVAVHILPTSNAVDHGFYQFGPTLMFDYYVAAGFDVLEAAATIFEPRESSATVLVSPVQPGAFGAGLLGAGDARVVLTLFAARKKPGAVEYPTPTQSLYCGRPAIRQRPRWFPPYQMCGGRRLPAPEPLVVTLNSISTAGGLAWAHSLPPTALGDSLDHPIRSPLALFEDGTLLGPPHTIHDQIRKDGSGAYSHWENTLYFSTVDGTDPRTNGRCYRAVIPALSLVERSC
jgi:hypothetical protein